MLKTNPHRPSFNQGELVGIFNVQISALNTNVLNARWFNQYHA